jgi:transcriptional repressor NrdR
VYKSFSSAADFEREITDMREHAETRAAEKAPGAETVSVD